MVTNILTLLQNRVQEQPDKTGFIFLKAGEDESGRLTFAELERQARMIAGVLQSREVVAGDRVLITCSHPREYVPAFWGCLFAGAIAVPACSPRNHILRDRLRAIAVDAEPKVILGDQSSWPGGEPPKSMPGLDIPLIAAGEAIKTSEFPWQAPGLTPDSVAMLQYTSGSTANPKGVVLRHSHLLNNQRMIAKSFETDSETVIVSWLPLHHDMGLMGVVLHPVQVGCECIMMMPEAFLRSPQKWLGAISKYGGTVSGGPNFAYELCTRRITAAESEELTLSSWKVAFNGAEIIRPDVLRSFVERFASSGFRSSAFLPCYGLAEATLLVTACSPGIEPKILELSRDALANNAIKMNNSEETRSVVECGVSPEMEVLIVDPQTLEVCDADRVGEVWVGGSSVGSGYWNSPELSKSVFEARCGDHGGNYLRTGDLGFLKSGSLFITGRLKDVVIIRGQNYNAEDFEITVCEAHPALEGAVCVVFGAERAGTEELVVIAESAPRQSLPFDEVAASIRAEIAQKYQLPIHTIAFVRRGGIPRTSSGKRRRRECQQAFERGDLALLKSYRETESSSLQSTTQIEAIRETSDTQARQVLVLEYLREQIAKAMNIAPEEPGAFDVLPRLGIDSLKAAELQGRIQKDCGVSLPVTTFLDGESLESLARQIVWHLQSAEQVDMPAACLGPGQRQQQYRDLPLSPEQERLYLIEQWGKKYGGQNLTAAFYVTGAVDPMKLEIALSRVVQRHFLLRSRILKKGGFLVAEFGEGEVHFALEVKPLDMPLDDLLDAECRVPFDLGTAPLIRAKLLQVTENTGYLVITLPHIISDAWSLGVVARDLTKLYGQEKNSLAIFPDRAECEVLSSEASRWSSDQGQGLASQLSYWRAVLATELPQFEWLRGSPDPLGGGGRTYTFGIGNDTATAVDALARKLGCTAFVVFLTAFELLISRLSHSEDVVVGIPLRTRKADAESVIGLLAHPVPLRSTVNLALSFTDLVSQTREKVLEAMANQEVPFTRILDFAQAKSGRQFLLPVMFTMIEGPALAGDGIHLRPFAYRFGCGGTEAFLTLDAGEGKMQGVLAYDSSTVPLSRAQLFCSNYLSQLEACVAAPMLPMCDLAMPQLEPENTVNGETGCTIALTSTFTAHAIEATLRLWLESMHLPVTYRITPGGEMLQQLLDPKSELARSGASFHVHLVRLSDLYANDRTTAHEPTAEIAAAIKAFSNRSKAPAVICICPSQTLKTGARQLELTEAERKLKNHFIGCNNLTVLTHEEVLASYAISDIFDSLTDRLAQLPYSRDYFAALSSMIMRRAYMWHHTPAKAIIVDADGTLWEGACSEDGPLGLSIGDGRLALQRFLVAQSKAGCLLCLCSRNCDDDIKAAFAAHPKMPLQLQDFVARRVNHEPKSENLRSLASQLNIALTECLFVDDDPVECAEVRANCPEAVVLHLQPLQSSQSLKRVWELDRGSITAEDQQRTIFYTAEAVREHAHKEAISLQAFIDSLELELDIEPMAAEHVARVSQLTFRTNQFNCTGARLTEAELTSLTEQANQGRVRGLVVHARDRFGDYGLIGALAYRFDAGEMRVDWWSLSCRVLNRGVEHRILAYLGRCAVEGNASSLTVNFQESEKNIRAGAFLSCGSEHVAFADGRSHFVWDARDASECRFSISEQPHEGSTSSVASGKATRVGGSIWKNAIAPKELRTLDAAGIVRAAARLQAQNKERPSPLDRPQTPTQARLVRIWADLLGVDDLGVNETLYSAGGQSLIAIQMLSRIREDFGIELQLMSVFTEDLTVATLAQVVDDALIAHADEADLLNEISELKHLSDHEVSALLGAETVK